MKKLCLSRVCSMFARPRLAWPMGLCPSPATCPWLCTPVWAVLPRVQEPRSPGVRVLGPLPQPSPLHFQKKPCLTLRVDEVPLAPHLQVLHRPSGFGL